MKRFRFHLHPLMLVAFFAWHAVLASAAEEKTVTLRVTAVNPSRSASQSTRVRIPLPREVRPKDIVEKGELEVSYDTEESVYYLFKDNIELAPLETRVFEIEIKDVWVLPETELETLRQEAEVMLARLKGHSYASSAETISRRIFSRLQEIKESQSDPAISRDQHIGIYRSNLGVMEDVKEDLARLGKFVALAATAPTSGRQPLSPAQEMPQAKPAPPQPAPTPPQPTSPQPIRPRPAPAPSPEPPSLLRSILSVVQTIPWDKVLLVLLFLFLLFGAFMLVRWGVFRLSLFFEGRREWAIRERPARKRERPVERPHRVQGEKKDFFSKKKAELVPFLGGGKKAKETPKEEVPEEGEILPRILKRFEGDHL